RVGVGHVEWAPTVVPVVASMFMFRMVLYAADLAPGKVPLATRLSYFFMFPNVFFPLFPIVDWGLWRRDPRSPLELLQRRGVQWIARGVVHLLVYRLVYHLLLPSSWDIVDAASVVQWIAAVYLLYLRI